MGKGSKHKRARAYQRPRFYMGRYAGKASTERRPTVKNYARTGAGLKKKPKQPSPESVSNRVDNTAGKIRNEWSVKRAEIVEVNKY
jgi:hypothetical protein